MDGTILHNTTQTRKQLWQLTHTDIAGGTLALARCPRCRGKGVYTQTLHRFDSGDLVEAQQHVPCDCRQRARDLLAAANIPPGRFATAALGDLDWRTIAPPSALAALQRYATRLDDAIAHGLGLLLTGDVGAGKTHLTIGLVRLACALGIEARFHTLPGLLARLRATYERPGQNNSRRPTGENETAIPLLALDDLSAEKPSDWMRSRLYTLIDQRYTARQPTIVTSHLPLPALTARLGKRTLSRLTGTTLTIHLTSPDHRPRAKTHLLRQINWTSTERGSK